VSCKVHRLAGAVVLLEEVDVLEVVGVVQLHVNSVDVTTETDVTVVCGLLASLTRRRVLGEIVSNEKVLQNVEHDDYQVACNIGRARINKHQLQVMRKLFGKLGLNFLLGPSANLVEDHAADLRLGGLVVVLLLREGGGNVLALRVGMDVGPVDRIFVHFHNHWRGQLRLPVIQRDYHIVLIALASFENLLVLLRCTENQLMWHRRGRCFSFGAVEVLRACVDDLACGPKLLGTCLGLTSKFLYSVCFFWTIVGKVNGCASTCQSKGRSDSSDYFAGKRELLRLLDRVFLVRAGG
jgi:hypothetical protein